MSMPVITTKTRKTLIALGVLAGLALAAFAALAIYGQILGSRNPYGGHNSYGMRDYTPKDVDKAAQSIVAGLNTHNPDKVDLIRNHSGNPDREDDNAQITANITAVLPAAGCQYTLVSTKDEGEQGHPADLVPWFSNSVGHARGFDMNLRQLCPGHPSTARTIRVIAVPGGMGGYWAEAALYSRAASATG